MKKHPTVLDVSGKKVAAFKLKNGKIHSPQQLGESVAGHMSRLLREFISIHVAICCRTDTSKATTQRVWDYYTWLDRQMDVFVIAAEQLSRFHGSDNDGICECEHHVRIRDLLIAFKEIRTDAKKPETTALPEVS